MTTERFQSGLGFGLGYDPEATVREMADSVAQAEAAGFSMGFFSETFYTNRDSVSALAAFAMRTQHLALGATQVVRLRSPLVMAQTAATLDELSGGRLVLVVGAATDKHAVRNGIEPMKPSQILREYIESIRLLLTGQPVTYEGQFVRFENVGLNFTPVRSSIPIWVAGSSPLGLRISAQLGDGILLDAGTSPEYSANALARIRETRTEADLGMADYSVAQLINTSIASTRAEALDAIRWEVASKFKYASTGRGKIAVGETAIPSDAPDRLSAIYQSRGEQALLDAIDDDFAAALTASGTETDVANRVQQYRDAGVNFPILRATAPHQIPELLAGAARFAGAAH
ncbi:MULTISPECIES: LLM class flavin-dependent oxidoreductase [Streptomyces]|uniref:LLM class flavin-dependent oxidoreductase n=1 Tax=Streptomyces lycopersici TaxID=2974589 RepID=UPI0021D3768F|nr:LLM class flavin-dependent oxidoreductase [Streptomyces sp. NEAU-383]